MIGRRRNCWVFVVFIAVLALCAASVHAAEIQAVVDRTQIGPGESLELTVIG